MCAGITSTRYRAHRPRVSCPRANRRLGPDVRRRGARCALRCCLDVSQYVLSCGGTPGTEHVWIGTPGMQALGRRGRRKKNKHWTVAPPPPSLVSRSSVSVDVHGVQAGRRRTTARADQPRMHQAGNAMFGYGGRWTAEAEHNWNRANCMHHSRSASASSARGAAPTCSACATVVCHLPVRCIRATDNSSSKSGADGGRPMPTRLEGVP